MSVDWEDVESDPEYKSLNDADKLRVQGGYFEDNIAPNVPKESLAAARKEFMAYRPEPTMPKNVVAAAKAAGRLTGEQMRQTRDAAAEKIGKDPAAAGESAARSTSLAPGLGGEANDRIKVITKSVAEAAKISKAHEYYEKEVATGLPEYKDFKAWQDRANAASFSDKLGDVSASGLAKQSEGISKAGYKATQAGLARMNAGLARIPSLTVDMYNWPGNALLKAAGRPERARAPEWLANNPAAIYYDEQAKLWSKDIKELDEDFIDLARAGDWDRAGRVFALQLAHNAPSAAVSVAAAFAGGGLPALSMLGAVSAAEANAAHRAAGVDPVSGVASAVIEGGAEALFERSGTFNIIEKMGASLYKAIGKGGYVKVMGALGKTLAASIYGEGKEELQTEFTQSLARKATGTDPDAMRGVGKRMATAGLLGAASGGTMTFGGAIANGTLKARISEARANGDEDTATSATEGAVINVVGKAFSDINTKMGEEATPKAVQAAAKQVAEAVQSSLDQPWPGYPAMDQGGAATREGKPLPIDPDKVAAMVLAAGVDGPDVQELANKYPFVFAAADNKDIPQRVQVKYSAWLDSVARKLDLPAGVPVTPAIIAHAIKTGQISYIETGKLNKALLEAAVGEQGADPATVTRLYADGMTAAERPAETLVAFHAEAQAGSAYQDARGRAARITNEEAERVGKEAEAAPAAQAQAEVAPEAPQEQAGPLPGRAEGIEQAMDQGIPASWA